MKLILYLVVIGVILSCVGDNTEAEETVVHAESAAVVETNTQTPVQPDDTITYSGWYVTYNTYIVGADGHTITIARCGTARQPTYNELINFLKADNTDEGRYITGEYVCADFAEDLQHSAVKAGYQCGYVSVTFTDSVCHACNVFNTTDRGIIYVDCTGSSGNSSRSNDCIVDIVQNEEYIPEYITPSNYNAVSMGRVRSFGKFW